jgi:hypothetical protein
MCLVYKGVWWVVGGWGRFPGILVFVERKKIYKKKRNHGSYFFIYRKQQHQNLIACVTEHQNKRNV